MLQHRCPWCGEIISVSCSLKNILFKFKQKVKCCPACKKPYIRNSHLIGFIIAIIVLAITYVIIVQFIESSTNYIGGFRTLLLEIFLLLIGLVIDYLVTPYTRYINKNRVPFVDPNLTVGTSITWKKHRQKGLRLPRFQVLDGEIFPACFMDKDGTPISTALCVILEKIRWTNSHRCTCNISFVLDDVPEKTFFQKGNRFYLYHNYRKIAEGTILGTEKHKLKRTGD